MNIAAIMVQFFQDQLGAQYRVDAFRNAVQDYAPASEIMRVVQSTDEIIAKMIADKTTRAVLRTSQSDYIGLKIADGASFTWSLEFAAPVNNTIDTDMEKIRVAFTEKIIPVRYKDKDYELLLVFAMPAKFAANTINGTNYMQVVWGGRATLVVNSVLANGYSFYIDGARIPGVLSLSGGFTAIGENYGTERSTHQRTALQTFTNAVGLSVHATKNDPIIQSMIAASTVGSLVGFAFEIRQYGVSIAQWEVAVYNQVNTAASLGSYVLIDAQILRS
ncbi:MAG: hypothetical protein HFE46_07230 [Clostridia bacterium]|nr:hypothetical protein [Clostridia bacterium]